MISSSAQRFSLIYRSTAILLCGLVLFCLLGTHTHAQGEGSPFRGTWQLETPEQGALILIVKSQDRASYFWGDTTDRTVYQGTWTRSEDAAILTWADGSRHRIEPDTLGTRITYITTSGTEQYTAPAQKLPSEVLGQWAKPPKKADESVSDRDKAKGFFGIWKIGAEEATADYVFVEPDRSAATTAGGKDGLRGSWAKQGSELHIAWENGYYSILRPAKRAFTYKIIESGKIIEEDTSEMRPTARTNRATVPPAWFANYQKERTVYTRGIAFSSPKNARAFYRGDWIIKRAEDRFEQVEIQRFGGLNTSIDRSLEGDWKMQGQDIFMRWDDGMRKILSPVGRGFVLYEYKPGRPLDGVPTRLYAAAPADSAKLTEHLKGRKDAAQQIIQRAKAAGIDSDPQAEGGWGRTFARWVWPFGADEAEPSPDTLLEEEFEDADKSDPWWWPFWSEDAASEPASSTPNAAPTGTEATSEDAASKENATDAPPESTEQKRRSARDWIWPF